MDQHSPSPFPKRLFRMLIPGMSLMLGAAFVVWKSRGLTVPPPGHKAQDSIHPVETKTLAQVPEQIQDTVSAQGASAERDFVPPPDMGQGSWGVMIRDTSEFRLMGSSKSAMVFSELPAELTSLFSASDSVPDTTRHDSVPE